MRAFPSKILLGAAFAASLLTGACGKPSAPADDFPLPVDAWSQLAAEAYGGAELQLGVDTVAIASSDAGEGGVTLTLLPETPGKIAIFFRYSGDAPANLRTENADGSFSYSSTAAATYVVLGENAPRAALLYGPAGSDFSLKVRELAFCGAALVCRDDGTIAWRVQGADGSLSLVAESYGTSEISIVSATAVTAESSGSGEFGVILRPEVRDDNRYLLEFALEEAGRSLLISGPQSKAYASADQGWILLEPDESALIYSAGPDKLQLTKLNLRSCGSSDWRCAKDADLAQDIAGPSPDLKGAVDLAAWATRESDFGFSAIVSDPVIPGSLTASQMHARFYRDDVAGGYCGATAVFLARLLRAKGYDAFSLDFGIPGSNLTHVTTITFIGGKYYLLDATFGGYFAKPETLEPLDILSILDGADFDLVEFDADARDFIVDPATYKRNHDPRLQEFQDCKVQPDTKFLVCTNPSFGLAQYLAAFSSKLEEVGLPRDTTTLPELLKRGIAGIGDVDDTDSMRTFARDLKAKGVPFHETPGSPGPTRLLDSD